MTLSQSGALASQAMATPWGAENGVQRMTYLVIPQKGNRYGVEMISHTGKRTLVPDFRDQAEARAWTSASRSVPAGPHTTR